MTHVLLLYIIFTYDTLSQCLLRIHYVDTTVIYSMYKYNMASQVAHLVNNPPTMQEMWVRSLRRKDALEEGTAAHSSIPSWRIPMDRGAWGAIVHGVTKSRTQLKGLSKRSTQI